MNRHDALNILRTLPKDILEAFALVVETAESQGDYTGGNSEDGSWWEESVSETLNSLASEIRHL